LKFCQNRFHITAGIDDRGPVGLRTPDNRTILLQRGYRRNHDTYGGLVGHGRLLNRENRAHMTTAGRAFKRATKDICRFYYSIIGSLQRQGAKRNPVAETFAKKRKT
jgi:hypothetical protein